MKEESKKQLMEASELIMQAHEKIKNVMYEEQKVLSDLGIEFDTDNIDEDIWVMELILTVLIDAKENLITIVQD